MAQQDKLLQFFKYDHIPDHIQHVRKPFGDLAKLLDTTLPSNPEKSMALRKLLESKDCAIRAQLFKHPEDPEDHEEIPE